MSYQLLLGDCVEVMRTLPAGSVQCCVTSPPYFGLRDYQTATWEGGDAECDHVWRDMHVAGMDGSTQNSQREGRRPPPNILYRDLCGKCGARRIDNQIGLEETPEAYIAKLVEVFREVRRLLRDDGILFLNLGDSYAATSKGTGGKTSSTLNAKRDEFGDLADDRKSQPWMDEPIRFDLRASGLKPKDLIGIPWAVAFALRADGWWLRSEIIWHKKAPMPESVTDRPTKAHEQVFLLTKSASYYYDAEAIAEPATMGTDLGILRTRQQNLDRNDYNRRQEAIDAGIDSRNGNPSGTRNKRSVWTLGPEQFTGWLQTSRSERVERHDVSGDTNCIVSQDCPVHGGLFDWAATDSYDVRAADLLTRIGDKRSRRAPKQSFGSVPTDQQRVAAKPEQNSDLPLLPYSLFATDHSNGSHRTAPDPATNQPCNASDQTPDRIDDKSNGHGSDTPSPRKSLSSKAEDDLVSSAMSEILSRNAGNSESSVLSVAYVVPPECTCSFYHEITDSTSHFATMPTKLVEPCILAGTSAHGCCSECGAPWERVVEREREGESLRNPNKLNEMAVNGAIKGGVNNRRLGPDVQDHAVTLGWQPTCTCNAAVVPCTVLDPFCGSGTTLAVALKHGRNGIAIDLNASYLELAHDRIRKSQPMLLAVT